MAWSQAAREAAEQARENSGENHTTQIAAQHGIEGPAVKAPFTEGLTLAGHFKISPKDPSTLTNGQLAKEYENLTMHRSAVGRDLINTGRGMETPKDRVGKTDDLSMMDRALTDRIDALQTEHHYRQYMGGRQVKTEDGRTKIIGKSPPSLKSGYYP